MKFEMEGFRRYLQNKYIAASCRSRRRCIGSDDFTIVSNDCWGGRIYNSYGILKRSPTVGMFFFPSDYLKFVKSFEEYIKQPLEIIDCHESRYRRLWPSGTDWLHARLEDVEIQLLHYTDPAEAIEKWNRRIKRINLKNIIFKFDDQNGCTEKDITEFLSLPYDRKVCFVSSKGNFTDRSSNQLIVVDCPSNTMTFSYEPFGKSRYIDINKLCTFDEE